MTVLPLYNVMLIPETNLYLQTQAFTAMTGKEPGEAHHCSREVTEEERGDHRG